MDERFGVQAIAFHKTQGSTAPQEKLMHGHGSAFDDGVIPPDLWKVDVRSAIEHSGFEAWFQPIVSTSNGRICTLEALSRWSHPVHGIVTPGRFLSSIERMGLIDAFTDHMMTHAMDALSLMRAQGHSDICVSVNAPWNWLASRNNVQSMADAMSKRGIPTRCLVFEAVEHAPPSDLAATVLNATTIKDLGFMLAMDDFGSGFNSLELVRHIPFDAIKIDRSLVHRSSEDHRAQTIVCALVDLIHGVGSTVTLEGIERASEFDMAQRIGADAAQGYLIGRPSPLGHVMERIVGKPPGA